MKIGILPFVLVAATSLIPTGESANILFFFGLSTYSHRITVWPLVEELAERGHSVTFLQPSVNKNPNPKVKEIIPKANGSISGNEDDIDTLSQRISIGPNGNMVLAFKLPFLGEMVCNELLADPEMLKWINTSKFDLVVIDALYNDCGLGLAHKWGAQTAIFGTTTVFEWWPDAYGFHAESNWLSILHYGQDLPLNFFKRVVSTIGHLYFRFSKVGILHPKIGPLLREKLDIPNMPSLTELESNVSLILVNSHFSEDVARSIPPLIVPVGGMHCTEKTKPLPKDIENFINESGKEGFMYVSFGSMAQIRKAPKAVQDIFFNAFKKTKIRFVWKWEGPRPADMPKNVYTAGWLPQQAILAHPKIRGFITHGGLLSMQEAIFNGVPMISFPIFAEQDYNAERMHRTKRGIRLEISSLTEAELDEAINKILTDDTYSKNVRKTSIVFKDRPQKPVDTAIWWVEYILRHKDTNFLRPLSISQTWYQRRLLDVWAFIAAIILIVLWLIVFILRKLISCCCKTSPAPLVQAKKSKAKKQ